MKKKYFSSPRHDFSYQAILENSKQRLMLNGLMLKNILYIINYIYIYIYIYIILYAFLLVSFCNKYIFFMTFSTLSLTLKFKQTIFCYLDTLRKITLHSTLNLHFQSL